MGKNKTTTALFGHFRPRFFIILSIVIIALALSYVAYSYATPTYMLAGSGLNSSLNSSINATYSIAGNGEHNLTIEVTILNGLHGGMSGVAVGARTNIGTVTSCTTQNGTCFIHYAPPRTANYENAILFVNVGGLHKNINVNVTPDYPTQLLLTANMTNQSILTFTNSNVRFSVKAIDAFGNSAPNGTEINFSMPYNNGNSGYLSATSCLTVNGMCNTTYFAPQSPTAVYIVASSDKITGSFDITVLSRLIKTNVLNFGNGGFCIASTQPPYSYEDTYLRSGENITWSLNQTLPISAAFVLNGYGAFVNFTNLVQNANAQFVNFINNCFNTGGFYGFNSSNALCQAYDTNHEGFNPYLDLQSGIQNLNPVVAYMPTQANYSYVGNFNFYAPVSNMYYFVVFPIDAPAAQPFALPSSGNPLAYNPYCYGNSYVYNTTIYGK